MKQLTDIIHRHILDALSDTHTSLVGKVVKVDATTIDIQPVTNLVYKGKDLKLPVFSKVPPVFMQGGGSYTAHPIAVGDYALIVFTERSFDRWYAGVDDARPPEFRMHDYSDGFAIVGINPELSAITIPTVITHIGDTYQEGDYEHLGNRTQTGDHTQTGNMTITGDLTVDGDITCTGTLTVPTIMTSSITASVGVSIAGIDFGTHTHGGVQTGTGSTGGPQ